MDISVGRAAASAETQQCQPYQLTLITGGALRTSRLPSASEGEALFAVGGVPLVSAFIRGGEWWVAGAASTILDTANNVLVEASVCDGATWYLVCAGDRQMLIAEALTPGNFGYSRYRISEGDTVRIGRGSGCDIRFDSPYMSKEHAEISLHSGTMTVRDAGSANGVFVNGRRTEGCGLSVGDTVSILSLRIIVGVGFLAINSGKAGVEVSRRLERYVPFVSGDLLVGRASCGGAQGDGFYNRLPRRRLAYRSRGIDIEMPPLPISETGIPLMLRMGGSAVHGAASALSGNPVMLLSAVLFPFLSEKFTEKQRREYECRRTSAYAGYLRAKEEEIKKAKQAEESVLRANYPELGTVLSYPLGGGKLWERRKEDDDFLLVRVGHGSSPLSTEIRYPQERFCLESDKLEEDMYQLAKKPVSLENVPIMIDFTKHRVGGVTGSPELCLELARQLLLRLSTLYSYDELKIVVIARPETLGLIGFARYIPHVWNDRRDMRLVASTAGEAYLVGEYLSAAVGGDVDGNRPLAAILKERPYYFVISLDKSLQDCMEVLKACGQADGNCGLTCLSLFDELPKDCSVQISLSDRGVHAISDLRDIDREDEHFLFDALDSAAAAECARIVSNTALKAVAESSSLPSSLSFLDMYGAGKVAHLNIPRRWGESDPVASLAAPVGVDTLGNTFNLDLHQRYQGPHGLVAGMTGSGKSEFLLTYILSMAVNYRPDEVSFVLIDYKGGGLAGAFEDERRGIRLPHLAGTITNLDGPAIQRSLISLQSETLRRQRVFNEVKSASGESTMDIYAYQRLRRKGVVDEPVPHLFIISDEFAELRDQRREFLDQLISIARIGRSLGIHLILATQKPAGIVNDQILSNTKFRVCLKVQTRNESTDVLKRPEAAELKETGRFYLQVGYNELFALGQSAWSGAPYVPRERAVVEADRSVSLVDGAGQEIVRAKPAEERPASQGSQLSAVVSAVAETAAALGIAARRLWTPPLKSRLDVGDLEPCPPGAGGLTEGVAVPVGMVDDPRRQCQYPLTLDLGTFNHLMVAGSARSGKTTLVQTLLLQLVRSWSPADVNVYALDYSGRLLGLFRRFPHFGAVLTDAHDESLDSFFDLVSELVEERRELFASLGVDSFEAARESVGLPVILVVIDNYSGLSLSKRGEAHAYRMDEYLKTGAQYGVKYVITCNRPADVNMRARQEIDGRIALHAKDKFEYEEILNNRVTYVPPDNPGRGLCVMGGEPLEVQIACAGARLDAAGRTRALGDEIEFALAHPVGVSGQARRLAVVDESIGYGEFCDRLGGGGLPLGYNLADARAISLPFRQFTGLSVYFGSQASARPVLENLAYAAEREGMHMLLVARSGHSSFPIRAEPSECDMPEVYEASEESVAGLVRAVTSEMQDRQRLWEDHKAATKGTSERKDAFDFVCGVSRPWLVVFERFEEVYDLGGEVAARLSGVLPLFHEFNMYAVGCFYPEDRFGLSGSTMYRALNKDGLAMLFGGRYSRQGIVDLPGEYARVDSEGEYNKFLMSYRGRLYPMLMPFSPPSPIPDNRDEASIFEQGVTL